MNLSRLKMLAALVLTLSFAGVIRAQSYVNVTVGGAFAPGVFGQISLGNNPPPPVWNAQPVIYGHPVYGAPVRYLHVPQEEYRDWGRHCGRYRACGHRDDPRIEHRRYSRSERFDNATDSRHDNRHDNRRGER